MCELPQFASRPRNYSVDICLLDDDQELLILYSGYILIKFDIITGIVVDYMLLPKLSEATKYAIKDINCENWETDSP